MVSWQHQNWINHGRPDSGLALPLQLLANTLAGAGYTVYTYPNDAHLDAQPPQDHTYYSETGWPGTSPKWWRHALDIMPKTDNAAGGRDLQRIGQRLFDARQAGRIAWLKYMNWPSDGDLTRAVQDSWKPGHSRGSSGDTGHIHISSTTGCETLNDPFNPLAPAATANNGPAANLKEPIMFLAISDDNKYYACDGAVSVPRTLEEIAILRGLRDHGFVDFKSDPAHPGNGTTLEFPVQHWNTGYGAPLSQPVAPAAAAPLDPAVLQAAVEAALRAVGVSVSPAQVAAALEDPAVRAVLVAAAEEGSNLAEDS
jgi:hypothetical protein